MSARRFGLWLLIVVVVGVAACSDGDDDEDAPGAGVPNPASVFCEEQGGTVEIVTNADGSQTGMCRLPDGTEVDEWEYYRESQGEGGGVGIANPAAVFCEEQGGIVSGVEPMCELPDGTVVDAWEYFRESSEPGP